MIADFWLQSKAAIKIKISSQIFFIYFSGKKSISRIASQGKNKKNTPPNSFFNNELYEWNNFFEIAFQ